MFGMLLLIIRRSLRNGPITLAVLVGLLVLVTLMVAAPLYTAALADVGLRATLADAPLDQRSVRIALPSPSLQEAEHRRLTEAVTTGAQAGAWLKPSVLSATRTKRLFLPRAERGRRVTLVEADTALENLRVVEGRLPAATGANDALEVVLGATAAEQFGIGLGDTLALAERNGGDPLVPIVVVGLVEPADPSATFWQSGVLDLEPVSTATQQEATLLVAPEMVWRQIVPRLPAERASGEYRWRVVFDTTLVDGRNALEAERSVGRVQRDLERALPGAEVGADFGGIVEDYRRRLSIARAPILLLLSEIAGLALIYIAWTAAFQAEASAGEQAVMGARGAGVRQIAAISGGQAAILALGAALAGIPLALLVLRVTVNLGPVAPLARAEGLRLVATPDAGSYALGASLVGLLTLALPAIPAARRSIVALRQGAARPAQTPLWQRTYLDLFLVVLAAIAFVQLQRQGSMLQQLRGRFEIDPFLLVAPLLVLVAGALLFLRAYPLLLDLARGTTERLRGLPLSLALVQLTRNRAASTRLVLLLSLAVALGLFAQTFGATLALNQRQRAGYTVGADGRATLTSSDPLLAGALPAGVESAWALRDTLKAAGGQGAAGTLLAIDPRQFGAVAFNPPERPIMALDAALAAFGDPAPEYGIAIPGRPRRFAVTLDLDGAPLVPAVVLADAGGRFHRLRLEPLGPTAPTQEFAAALDLPPAAYPLRLAAFALLPNSTVRWGISEETKPPVTVGIGPLRAGETTIERWDGANDWQIAADTPFDPDQAVAGAAELLDAAGRPSA